MPALPQVCVEARTAKAPCPECPFRRKSWRGWIGAHERPEEIVNLAEHAAFPCHKSVNALVESGNDMDAALADAHLCAGSLAFLNNSCTRSRSRAICDAQDIVGTRDDVFRFRQEFIDHHTPPEGTSGQALKRARTGKPRRAKR